MESQARQVESSKSIHICSFVSTECGSVVNNTLKSPGYPEDYPNNMDCNYTVPIPPGVKVKYVFDYFKLEDPDGHRKCR